MQGCKACFRGTLDGGGAALVLEQSQLTKTASIGQSCNLLEAADGYRSFVVWVDQFEYLLMDQRFPIWDGFIECAQRLLLIEVSVDVGGELVVG